VKTVTYQRDSNGHLHERNDREEACGERDQQAGTRIGQDRLNERRGGLIQRDVVVKAVTVKVDTHRHGHIGEQQHNRQTEKGEDREKPDRDVCWTEGSRI